MHECEHGYACDCDGDDTWLDRPTGCVCECDDDEDLDDDELTCAACDQPFDDCDCVSPMWEDAADEETPGFRCPRCKQTWCSGCA